MKKTALQEAIDERMAMFIGRIKLEMRYESMTLEDVAEFAELEPSTVHRIVSGITKPTLETAYALSMALGVEL